MKFYFLLFLSILTGWWIGGILYDQYFKPQVNPPEEWKAITNNPTTPDTMLVYRTGSTIHILFNGKHK